ncbi:tetratricopeptide repeat protein [Nonlabens sp.]|uniref:tetratricopeptide repeat protein n=1 Tax=Nonlabens sp. TaxID=1888209 RepID=UPI003F4AD5C4
MDAEWNDSEVYFKRGEYEKAIESLDKIIEQNPKHFSALINRGVNKTMLKDYNGGLDDYLKVVEHDPENTLALFNLGDNHKRLKNYSKSIEYFSKALETSGAIKSDSLYIEFLDTPFTIGSSPFNLRKYEIEFERGVVYVKAKQYNLAIKDLKESLKYNHNSISSICWIGEAYYHLNDTINARLYLEEASKHGDLESIEMLKKINK